LQTVEDAEAAIAVYVGGDPMSQAASIRLHVYDCDDARDQWVCEFREVFIDNAGGIVCAECCK
jgi:hypothetical protein